MATRRVLGIDLGGASSATTGYALVTGARKPKVLRAGELRRATSPAVAEDELLELIDSCRPDVLAIDAPLTLPPCLSCPSYCRGPGVELCEIAAARSMWEAGSNPVSRRPCEVALRAIIPRLDPKPTMGLGIITARAIALVRKLANRGTPPASIVRGEVLEVYPRATLARLGERRSSLGPKRRDETAKTYRKRVLRGLASPAVGMTLTSEHRGRALASGHVLDAVIAAYTGWLGPEGLEEPPTGFNVASGWIWVPKR